MLGKVLGSLERAAFRPDTLPSSVVAGLAFVPPVVAGLLIFKLAALEMFAIAVAAGGLVHLLARVARQPAPFTPVIAAVVGVSLVGPGASILWSLAVAICAAVLDLGRHRFLPAARVHPGLLAYVAVLLIGRWGPAAYLNPPAMKPLEEPIRLWHTYYPAAAAPLDPIRLYIGNVPGPAMATSLMAVVIGLAWLWYARRLSLAVLAGFAGGAIVPILLLGWNPVFQLDSGPAWFAVGLILADRKRLPSARAPRPLLGFAAGAVAFSMRTTGLAIEATLITVAALQAAEGIVEGLGWTISHRRRVRSRLRRAWSRGGGLRTRIPRRRERAA